MEIEQTTTIKLEEAERNALETLKDAYRQCAGLGCFACSECPIYVDGNCIGMLADCVMSDMRG